MSARNKYHSLVVWSLVVGFSLLVWASSSQNFFLIPLVFVLPFWAMTVRCPKCNQLVGCVLHPPARRCVWTPHRAREMHQVWE